MKHREQAVWFVVCKLYTEYKYELFKADMFSEACISSTLETFHQIIVFVVGSEAVKTEHFSMFLKSQAKVLQWI